MKKEQKKILLNLVRTLFEAHESIRNYLTTKNILKSYLYYILSKKQALLIR